MLYFFCFMFHQSCFEMLISVNIREKAFYEMKKDVGMITAQKSKETRRMEMGSIFVLYIQPTISTYMYITTLATRRICRDCWLDIQNKD